MTLTEPAGGAPAAAATAMRRAVFLDKDGTLVENVPYNVDPALLRFTPNALEGLRLLSGLGYALVVVSNQSGLARGYFDRAALARLQTALEAMLARAGVHLRGFYVCPHAPSPDPRRPNCLCRMPAPGLLRQAACALKIDMSRSWMIGDTLNDVEAGRRAGCRTVLLDVGLMTQGLRSPLRTPHHEARDLLDVARLVAVEEDVTPPMRVAPQLGAAAQPA